MEDAKKVMRAIEIMMENLGRSYWCNQCEDWCQKDHFTDKHTG